jgi:sterol desaturase/sphingolipid hydroxylase (fatty acid hydroxylase superfamily)
MSEQPFGLLNLIELPTCVKFAVGFLLMDLTFYYWHQANHYVPILWRFHCVHHIDPDLDVSTSFRFHFGEVLYSVAFRAFQVSLIGVSPAIYIVYELAFQCATMFHHSNLCLPVGMERQINRVIVTPRMHGIHHSAVRNETNSNFSVIFRWWDALHGTLRLNVRQPDIIIGVPAYLTPEDNKLWNVLALPFRKQKEYWCLPDGRESRRDTTSESDKRNILLA